MNEKYLEIRKKYGFIERLAKSMILLVEDHILFLENMGGRTHETSFELHNGSSCRHIISYIHEIDKILKEIKKDKNDDSMETPDT
jgi:hypothetical protein